MLRCLSAFALVVLTAPASLAAPLVYDFTLTSGGLGFGSPTAPLDAGKTACFGGPNGFPTEFGDFCIRSESFLPYDNAAYLSGEGLGIEAYGGGGYPSGFISDRIDSGGQPHITVFFLRPVINLRYFVATEDSYYVNRRTGEFVNSIVGERRIAIAAPGSMYGWANPFVFPGTDISTGARSGEVWDDVSALVGNAPITAFGLDVAYEDRITITAMEFEFAPEPTPPVPLPPAALLLAGAFGALALFRRRTS